MKTTLTRLFTVMLLIMVSMGAMADVKVLFGEKGDDKVKTDGDKIEAAYDGGTIVVTQKVVDATKVTVFLTVTPNKGYTMQEKNVIEAYATAPANIGKTRAPEVSENLTLDCDNFKDEYSTRTYYVDVDPNLALWVKSATFEPKNRDSGAKGGLSEGVYVYYIASDGNAASVSNKNTTETYSWSEGSSENYYLVPTCEPASLSDKSDVYNDKTGAQKPFLTTYKTGQDNDAVWVLKQVTDDDGTFYYVIHAKTNKYVVYDPFFTGNNFRRKCMHLQALDSPTENAKFVIRERNDASCFIPKEFRNIEPDNKTTFIFWNIADKNRNSRKGLDGSNYYGGLVGLYCLASNSTVLDANSRWQFEPGLCDAPTIETVSENLYSITPPFTLPSGYTIRYTTDDDVIPGTNTGDEYTLDSQINITQIGTMRAWVVGLGVVLTAVATKTVGAPPTPTITLPSDCNNIVTMEGEGLDVYYTLDGTEPDNTSTLYTEPFALNVDATIKAITYNGSQYSASVATENYTPPYTPAPTITNTGNTVTITAVTGATIRYTVDGGSEQTYSAPFTVSAGYDHEITATAQIAGKGVSCLTNYTVEAPIEITTFAQLKSIAVADYGKKFSLGNDITADNTYTSIGSTSNPFTGSLNGNGHTISGLETPLFGTAEGAVIHDVNLISVSIDSDADAVGAIACVAKGYTRIYNCGILPNSADFPVGTDSHPSVSTTGTYAGSIVGSLEDDSRVVNCFSYADVSAGTTAAGIVGNNAYVSSTSNGVSYGSTAKVTGDKYTELRTMVVNCMFYGDIDASNIYPVYGGAKITNKGATAINNYNFYRNGSNFTGTLQDYNCSWPAEEQNLTRYEYYRNLLNSNRELCGWWVGAPSAPKDLTTGQVQAVPKDASLMAKWVLIPDEAPYPILKPFGKYASPVNIDAGASWRITANEWEGKKLGSIKVNINPGPHASTGVSSKQKVDFIVTDMDTLHADYCYRKIQLPYYNTQFGNSSGKTWADKYAGNYGEYVVTGWEITSIDEGGTPGTFINVDNPTTGVKAWESGYNFADRNCTNKDKYSVSGRVFAQGGYYYVPTGVKEITITAHWAKAIYLDNTGNSYDRVNMSGSNAGTHFAPAGKRSDFGNGRTINNGTINSVIPSSGSVYEDAIVLVGNYQYRNGAGDIKGSANIDGATIMGADLDLDDEPDHCLIWQLGNATTRQSFCPIRFDFLPVVELGMAMKEDGSTQYYSLGCYRPLGHFEVTETSLIHFGQFEFSNRDRPVYAPIILNGGIYDQYTKGHQTYAFKVADDRIDYIIIGGNARIPSFTPGAHPNPTANYPTRHCAVNIIGGTIDNIFLTGNYNSNVTPNTDNPHCYIDGGRIKHVAAAGKEGIDGDVYFKINHSKIWEFYGGSTLATKLITGNIDVTIDNSIVDKYCGGPKFGDMIYDENNFENGKTITTNANNTTFGVYYGGGNGGTSYVQYDNGDGATQVSSFSWSLRKMNVYTANEYIDKATGYKANYDMEIVRESTGTTSGEAVFRTYFYAAQFSATDTGPITNNLTDCTVLTNFYGAGNLGGVKGTVTSTLTDTKVYGSAFGAGFSATVPDVTIHEKDKTPPEIDVLTGIITPQSGGNSTTYTWCYKNNTTGVVVPSGVVIPSNVGTNNPGFEYNNKNYYYTEAELENLGAVTGAVSLTITGSDGEGKGSVIGTADDTTTGNVYGGGDASAVENKTNPGKAFTIVTLSGNTRVLGNVFGGGNKGVVSGSATVNIE